MKTIDPRFFLNLLTSKMIYYFNLTLILFEWLPFILFVFPKVFIITHFYRSKMTLSAFVLYPRQKVEVCQSGDNFSMSLIPVSCCQETVKFLVSYSYENRFDEICQFSSQHEKFIKISEVFKEERFNIMVDSAETPLICFVESKHTVQMCYSGSKSISSSSSTYIISEFVQYFDRTVSNINGIFCLGVFLCSKYQQCFYNQYDAKIPPFLKDLIVITLKRNIGNPYKQAKEFIDVYSNSFASGKLPSLGFYFFFESFISAFPELFSPLLKHSYKKKSFAGLVSVFIHIKDNEALYIDVFDQPQNKENYAKALLITKVLNNNMKVSNKTIQWLLPNSKTEMFDKISKYLDKNTENFEKRPLCYQSIELLYVPCESAISSNIERFDSKKSQDIVPDIVTEAVTISEVTNQPKTKSCRKEKHNISPKVNYPHNSPPKEIIEEKKTPIMEQEATQEFTPLIPEVSIPQKLSVDDFPQLSVKETKKPIISKWKNLEIIPDTVAPQKRSRASEIGKIQSDIITNKPLSQSLPSSSTSHVKDSQVIEISIENNSNSSSFNGEILDVPQYHSIVQEETHNPEFIDIKFETPANEDCIEAKEKQIEDTSSKTNQNHSNNGIIIMEENNFGPFVETDITNTKEEEKPEQENLNCEIPTQDTVIEQGIIELNTSNPEEEVNEKYLGQNQNDAIDSFHEQASNEEDCLEEEINETLNCDELYQKDDLDYSNQNEESQEEISSECQNMGSGKVDDQITNNEENVDQSVSDPIRTGVNESEEQYIGDFTLFEAINIGLFILLVILFFFGYGKDIKPFVDRYIKPPAKTPSE